MASTQERLAIFDIVKGIGIILVVYGHCLRGLTSADIVPASSWIQITDYVIYTFHMPVFFFVSGIFMQASMNKGGPAFWRSRFLVLVYPYFLWSLLQGSAQVVLAGSGATNGSLRADRLLYLLWDPISPFWFLHALFFATVLAYGTRSIRPEILLAGAFVAFLLGYFCLPSVMADITYGALYVFLGIFVQSRGWLSGLTRAGSGLTILVLAFAVIVALGYRLQVPDRLLFPAAALAIIILLKGSTVIEARLPELASLLASIGRASMSIYVMHILVLGAARVLMLRVFNISHPLLLLPISTMLAVFTPLLVQWFTDKLQISRFAGLPQLRWSYTGLPWVMPSAK
ncbi:acyltransferase family protein [Labrys neptuniae]